MRTKLKKLIAVFLSLCMTMFIHLIGIIPVEAATVTNTQRTTAYNLWDLPLTLSIEGVSNGTSISKSQVNNAVGYPVDVYSTDSFFLYTWQSANECIANVSIDRSRFANIQSAGVSVTANLNGLIGVFDDSNNTFAGAGIELSSDTTSAYFIPNFGIPATVTVNGNKGGSYTYSILNADGSQFTNTHGPYGTGNYVTNGSTQTAVGYLFGPAPNVGESVALRIVGYGFAWSSKYSAGNTYGMQENFVNLTITGVCSHSQGYASTSTDSSHLKSVATCTSPAIYYKSCTTCGANGTETFTSGGNNLSNHANVQIRTEIPATCFAAGHTAGNYCYSCNTWVSGDVTAQLSHSYTNYSHVDDGDDDPANDRHAATCNNNCGTTDTQNCSFVDQGFSASCSAQGYTHHTCRVCGFSYDDAYTPKADHNYGDWMPNGNGTHTKTCSACAADAEGHSVTADCSDFNETPHAATCAKGSYTTYECKQCGYTYDGAEADDKLAHDLSYTDNGDGTHTASCANCDFTVTADCYGGTATCLVKATCEGCGAKYGALGGHTLNEEPAVAPTCLAPGHVAYWHCSVCEKDFTDDTATAEIATFQSAHDYGALIPQADATCEEDGTVAHYHCSVCGSNFDEEFNPITDLTIASEGHVYGESDWTEPVSADCGNDGNIGYFTCSVCGKRFDLEGNLLTDEDIVIPATGDHAWGWITDSEPGCYTDGVQHQYCSVCKHTQAEGTPIPAAHEFDGWNEPVAPGCGSNGTVGYQHCHVCGDDFDANGNKLNTIVDPATGLHEWEWVTDTEPGCGTPGVKHEKCKNCTATRSENTPIDPTGLHEWEWVTDTEPGCGTPGVKHEKCKNCTATRSENTPIDPTGLHEWEWVTDTEPGCGTPGVKHEKCKNCTATRSENTAIEPTGNHSWKWVTDTAPTCVEPGVKHQKCENCTATQNENTAIDPTGEHSMTAHAEYKAPTCAADGNPEYWYCATCEKYYLTADGTDEGKTSAPVLHDENAHAYGDWTRISDTEHQRVCANNPAHVETKSHTWDNGVETGNATCLEPGHKLFTCTACGATKEEDTAYGAHDMTEHVEYKAPTCNADGNIEYWYCERCGAYFADEAGTTALTAADIVIPAAHRLTCVAYKAPTTEAEGNKEYWICELCGDYFADEAGASPIADKTSVILPKLTPETPTEPTDPTEPTTDNGGSGTTDFRISIWEWLSRIIRKLLSMFKFGGEGSIC